ncbi:hypothetical protein BDA96_04G119500 [Sorghum bicolor]|uniref:Uncharacterized protein n=1 Tax=Sorghum bicolor TaxID=4558 RepID=A0A921R3P6_SORBI|nr:hypothetical protein BDA96_04G119500 [Sorghum bicolor]
MILDACAFPCTFFIQVDSCHNDATRSLLFPPHDPTHVSGAVRGTNRVSQETGLCLLR